jgi:hypothetical protein
MKLYHRTSKPEFILACGFRDSTGTYATAEQISGVWLSDRPPDPNDGLYDDTVLVIDIPEGVVVPYEWVEASKGYREFHVPANIVNLYGRPAVAK